jgi:hypothetical protein
MKMRIGAIVFALLASAAVSAHADPTVVFTPCTTTPCQTTSNVSGLSGTVTYPGTISDSGGDVTVSTTTSYGFNQGSSPYGETNWLSLATIPNDQNITFTFTQPVDYVGFFWGSPDNSNLVYLYDGSTQIGAYVGGPSAEGDGSPIGIQAGYVDFSASAGEEITSIELLNAGSFWFETDNLSYQEAPVSSTPTPEPGSFLLLGSGLVGLAGMLRRKAVLHG